MRLLLISVNRERYPYPVFPIGLSYLTGPVRRAGHDVRVVDLCFADDPVAAAKEAIGSYSPDCIIISIRNIDNVTFPNSTSYLAGIREIVTICRSHAKVIVGGSGFSLLPYEVLTYIGADYGVVGEGEQVLPELLACISSGRDASSLPGVLSSGAQTFLPPVPVVTLEAPERSLFDVGRYHCEGGMANVQTKRGCPFSCIYCIYPLLEGHQVRLRRIPEVIAEIRSLVETYGVSYIYFVDDIFNYPIDYAENLCRAMAAERLPVNWSAFINPQFVSAELFSLMAAAGCDAVEFGTDSGSPSMLKNLGKSFTVEDIRRASDLCRGEGIDFAHYILFGGPGETEATIEESFILMDEIAPTTVIAMTGIRIYPGTTLYEKAVDDGIISGGQSLLEPIFYISPVIRHNLCEMVLEKAAKRRNWVAPGLDMNMSPAMMQFLRRMGHRGPLWKLMNRFRR